MIIYSNMQHWEQHILKYLVVKVLKRLLSLVKCQLKLHVIVWQRTSTIQSRHGTADLGNAVYTLFWHGRLHTHQRAGYLCDIPDGGDFDKHLPVHIDYLLGCFA